MSRPVLCRFGDDCRFHKMGRCRYYHPPSPTYSRTSSEHHNRSRSRDRRSNTNNRNGVSRLNLVQKEEQKVNIHFDDVKRLQFMTHGDGQKWGKINMKETGNGLQMTASSNFPTRMGRCRLMSGKYYYEVHLQSTPCNARIGWALPTQKIDDEKDERTGQDANGWAFNGSSSSNRGSFYTNGTQLQYGCEWDGSGDVVSTVVDISTDRTITRYYLNGNDFGEKQIFLQTQGNGLAPSISIYNKSSLVVVTDPRMFKYHMPNGCSAINTGFKMKWSRIIDKISMRDHKISRFIKEKLDTYMDGARIENMMSQLPLSDGEKQTFKKFIRSELDFAPVIEPTTCVNKIKEILIQNGFKNDIIQRVINECHIGKSYDESESMLSEMISKCVKYESENAQKMHLKNWREWKCLDVIEWIETIEDGHFKHEKYKIFKQYMKRMKLDGKQLKNINALSLKLLTLNDENDCKLMVKNVDTLTKRNQSAKNNEVPKEYLDPITFELMSDPVICIKSGYTYDRKSIINQIRTNRQDPFTRQRIDEKDLVPNRSIKDCIESWTKEHNLINNAQ